MFHTRDVNDPGLVGSSGRPARADLNRRARLEAAARTGEQPSPLSAQKDSGTQLQEVDEARDKPSDVQLGKRKQDTEKSHIDDSDSSDGESQLYDGILNNNEIGAAIKDVNVALYRAKSAINDVINQAPNARENLTQLKNSQDPTDKEAYRLLKIIYIKAKRRHIEKAKKASEEIKDAEEKVSQGTTRKRKAKKRCIEIKDAEEKASQGTTQEIDWKERKKKIENSIPEASTNRGQQFKASIQKIYSVLDRNSAKWPSLTEPIGALYRHVGLSVSGVLPSDPDLATTIVNIEIELSKIDNLKNYSSLTNLKNAIGTYIGIEQEQQE